jgi:hypothetical protein
MQGQRSGAVALCIRQSMIRKMPVPGLDPGMEAGFPKKILLHQNPRAKSPQSEAISH